MCFLWEKLYENVGTLSAFNLLVHCKNKIHCYFNPSEKQYSCFVCNSQDQYINIDTNVITELHRENKCRFTTQNDA